jgi:hypothetical protein
MKTTKKAIKAASRQSRNSRIDKPEGVGKAQMKWGSDVVAEVTRRLDLKYIALCPAPVIAAFMTASSTISATKIRRW